jgi:dynein heavy chain, axonemal
MLFHAGVRSLTQRFEREARRHFYVTPTSYLELLNAYKSLFARRHGEVEAAKRRYENGLDKLLFTESQVNTMKAELEVLKPQLIAASEATDALLVDVKRETAEADAVKAVVSVDEAKAKAEADKVTAIKEECEGDLAEAMPALNAAIKALDTLTKNDITEVKGMKSPPAAVKMVLEAVCIVKGLKAAKARAMLARKLARSQGLACARLQQTQSHHCLPHMLLLGLASTKVECQTSQHICRSKPRTVARWSTTSGRPRRR